MIDQEAEIDVGSGMTTMRAACVQFAARPDKADNIRDMAPLVADAAARGADVILLPEKWNAWVDGAGMRREAEQLDSRPDGRGDGRLGARAPRQPDRRLDRDRRAASGWATSRSCTTATATATAAYTKIHLFDVDVGGLSYRESDGTDARHPTRCVADIEGVRFGLTVCYDLRFPELYRLLTLEGGATVLTVPSNFTLHTGMAHWEVLLRARAIENQAYVLATGQHGFPGRPQQAVVRPQHDHRPLGHRARAVARR